MMMRMTKEHKNVSLDSIIDDMLDRIDPLDSRKVEDRLMLAARIGDLIAEKGLSKKQFADLMGQSPPVVSKWLGGTHNFTQDTLSAISYKLQVPMTEFFREREQPVIFKSQFAVTGVGASLAAPLIMDQRRFYGGPLDFDERDLGSYPMLDISKMAGTMATGALTEGVWAKWTVQSGANDVMKIMLAEPKDTKKDQNTNNHLKA